MQVLRCASPLCQMPPGSSTPHHRIIFPFRDDLPASGFLAATFCSQHIPAVLLALASPILGVDPFPGSRSACPHCFCSRVIHQDAAQIHTHVTDWHTYMLEWDPGMVRFSLDGADILQTNIVPHAPLSLVIWVDNQYAALTPAGRLKYGTLPNSRACLDGD